MFIYQIGNVVVRGFAEHTTDVAWKSEGVLNYSHSKTTFNNIYPLPELADYSLSGTITCWRGNSALKNLNILMSMGGYAYTEIIGYLPNDCCQVGKPCNTCCGTEGNTVKFYHTYGVITSIDRSLSFDSNPYPTDYIDVSISIQAHPVWQPMDKYSWIPYYGDYELSRFDLLEKPNKPLGISILVQEKRVGRTNSISIPQSVVPFHHEPKFKFYKREFENQFELYDPVYWEEWDNSAYTIGSGLKYLDETEVHLSVDQKTSALLMPMYCFEGDSEVFSDSGELQFDVTSYVLNNKITSTSYNGRLYITNARTQSGQQVFDDVRCYLSLTDKGNFVLTPDGELIYNIYTNIPISYNWYYDYRMPGDLIGQENRVLLRKNLSFKFAYLIKSCVV